MDKANGPDVHFLASRKHQHGGLADASLLNRLPTELVSLILQQAVTHDDPWSKPNPWTHYRKLHVLQMVCWYWNEIINTTPRFWNYNNFKFPPEAIITILTKSRELPIRFESVDKPRTFTRQAPSWEDKALEPIFKSFRRVQSMDICSEDYGRKFFEMIAQSPAPILERASFSSYIWNNSGILPSQLNLFNGNAPKIKSLSLYNTRVKWSSAVFSGLHHLTVDQRHLPILDSQLGLEVLEILRSCSKLKTLLLRASSHLEANLTTFGSGIILPDLEFMELDLPSTLLFSLHKLIRAPNAVGVSLSYHRGLSIVDQENLIAILNTWMTGDTDLSVHLYRGYTLCEWRHSGLLPRKLSVSESQGHGLQLLEILAASFQHQQLHFPAQTKAHSWSPSTLASNTINLLGGFPNAKSLFISRHNGSKASVLATLQHLQTPISTSGWPFPQLEELDIQQQDIEGASVIEMMQKRYNPQAFTKGAPPAPAPLKTLRVNEDVLSSEQLCVIKDIVGECDICLVDSSGEETERV